MARLLPIPYQMPRLPNNIGGWDAQFKAQERELGRLYRASDKLPKGKITGAVIKFQVADGYAYYLVTKDSPLTVQYIPFCDDYQAHPALIRGLARKDVEAQLSWDRALRRGV